MAELGLRRDLLPPLHEPGAALGTVRGVAGVDGLAVVAAASHDTASAVAGTPLLAGRRAVYISCGTWALVGCEVPSAVTTPAALAANVTNELGVGGRIRLLKNVTGLWLLEQCRDTWRRRGEPADLATLLAGAADEAGRRRGRSRRPGPGRGHGDARRASPRRAARSANACRRRRRRSRG